MDVGAGARKEAPISTETPFGVSIETRPTDEREPSPDSSRGARLPRRAYVISGLGIALTACLLMLVRSPEHLSAAMTNLRAHAKASARPLSNQDVEMLEPITHDGFGLEDLSPCSSEQALVVRDDIRVCVDRWEASLVEVLPGGEERPWSPFVSPASGRTFRAVSAPAVVPQAYVSRDQAEAACFASGKRLCGGREWRAACEGPERTKWPYGATEDPNACNSKGVNPLSRMFGGPGKIIWKRMEMNNPALNQIPGTVAKTGEFTHCKNEFGLYDMVGNVHEWTSEKKGVFRGGYYRDTHENGEGCRYQTKAHAASYHDYSTGFRCCRDPE